MKVKALSSFLVMSRDFSVSKRRRQSLRFLRKSLWSNWFTLIERVPRIMYRKLLG
jgi:hypothetical protein